MTFVVVLLAAAAAGLAFQVFYELRQRSLAAARAYGHKVQQGNWGLGNLTGLGKDIYAGLAARLQAGLPPQVAAALAERLDLAGQAQLPGALLLDMLLYFACGLLAGLALDLDFGTALIFGAVGLALPLLKVQDLGSRRQSALRRQLPDALDLLTACVEAGLGFDQALAHVAARLNEGVLRRELEATVAALGLGASRREALRDLARRLRLEELSQLIAALLQADKRGAPLGPALRAQSGQLRRLRTLRVKKLAAEAPLKMLFPLMAFILPVVFIVLFGPIALKWKAGGF